MSFSDPDSRPVAVTFSRPLFLFLAATLILIWGSAYTFVDVAVTHITPIRLVAYRLVLGAILVTAYAYAKGQRFPPLRDARWLWYTLLGVTGSVLPFFLISTGQIDVESGLTSILVGAMPILTIILAHFMTHEKLTARKLIGFVIGFMGIVILFLPEELSLTLVSNWQAQSLILAGAFCYALTTVIAKIAPETPSSVAAAMMLVTAAIIGVIALALTQPLYIAMAPKTWGLIVILGIGSTALGTILYLYVIKMTGPGMMARINYFVPVASVIFGVFFLNEPLGWRTFASFAIILIGVLISRSGETPAS